MRNARLIICSMLLIGILILQPILGEEGPTLIRAFPEAEGFGAYSKGGRGGKVYHVTILEDNGPGSLRWAVEAEGSRIVVFDISGTIQLNKSLVIDNPFITIAGQTAPGDGICLRDATLVVAADHVIIRYLRCRLGDEGLSGDAISINSGRNIIIDHCSASWSLDEVLSSSTALPILSDLTVQWCFITEALNVNNHGFGSLIRGCCGARYSYHHNLYAHNRNRNPRPGNYDNPNTPDADPNGLLLDFRNNVIYNWEGSYAGYNADAESITKLNYVGNYLIPGPNSAPTGKAYREGSPNNRGYFSGNCYNHLIPDDPWSVVNFNDWSDVQISTYKQSVPFENSSILTQNVKDTYQSVIKHGGANIPQRDMVDLRIVENVQKGEGRIINSQKEVGGWPDLKSAAAPRDTDRDGMPDDWELKHKLNPNDAADGSSDADSDGYTNVEEYLNNIGKI